MLDLDRLRVELVAACRDAGLDPGSLAVFAVAATRPAGTTPMAYLHPAGFVWPDTVAVFRAVGSARAGRYHLAAHRLALWGELPGLPPAALGAMLRHELQHAVRWERSGSRFFEADDLLRDALRSAGGDGYVRLPSELEANAAASAYAARTLAPPEREALGAHPDTAALVAAGEAPADVVEDTLAELARCDGWAPWLDTAGRGAYLAEVRAACAAWDEQAARMLTAGPSGPELHVVAPAGDI